MKEAFLFVLTGGLIDSESIYTGIWAEIDRRFPTGVENFTDVIKGSTLEAILDRYFPEPDVRKSVESLLYELESKIKYEFTPGAEDLLKYLNESGHPVALVTSSNKLKMKHLFSQIPRLQSYFGFIVTGDMVTRSKPDPEGYALAAGRLGASPDMCVVLEDSLQGVKAGERLGAKVIGVAGTLPAETLSPHSDMVISSLKELSPTLLESL